MSVVLENSQSQSSSVDLRWSNNRAHPAETQEALCGHLVMLDSGGNRPVLARLYNCTSRGSILCLWPDKSYSAPLGCINLRDTFVTCFESAEAFTLRHRNAEDLPVLITLACPSTEEYLRWRKVLQPIESESSGVISRRRKSPSSYVTRLPMLIEEETVTSAP